MLMSATTSQEVERLQALILHNPVTLNLLGGGADSAGTARGGEAGPGPGSSPEIEHFAVRCSRCCGCPALLVPRACAPLEGHCLRQVSSQTDAVVCRRALSGL